MPATFSRRVIILKKTISTELSKRGFILTTSNPDLLINIGINIKVNTADNQASVDGPVYVAKNNYSWKNNTASVGNYKEGTITLHFVDAKNNKLIWKGSVEGIVAGEAKTEESAKSGMALLFNDFPVAVK